ncbi:hypothetical protein B0H34DRAFT_708666 [Crassisporium funariophilum]|nr:hypothetical protein B0H34DRAFT_708666 [Crassisporium funariophilum]
MASISHLPNELLYKMFKELYNESQEPAPGLQILHGQPGETVISELPQPKTTWIEKDLYSPALFPFCVALVCRRWRDMLAQTPEMWNRIVLDVDVDPTPLLGAFSWSKDLQLEVLVVSRGEKNGTQPEQQLENQRVWSITKLLIPHIHRCSAVTYDITYSSSLPTLGLIFKQNPIDLVKLKVECRIEDGDHNGTLARALEARIYANVPLVTNYSSLRLISISGRLFMELGKARPHFLRHLQSDDYHYNLAISQFEFQEEIEDDFEAYTLSRFFFYMSGFSHFKEVSLRNLTLSYPPRSFQTLPPTSSIRLKQLNLKNLEGNFLSEFFTLACIHCDSMRIDRCIIPELKRLIKSPTIWLGHMADSESIINLLCSWSGTDLTLVKCPAFNDTVLDVLAVKGGEGGLFKANKLSELFAVSCSNFTSTAVRRVRSRLAMVARCLRRTKSGLMR